MCIVLLSNAHPAYALIVLSNRDEFLDRPTQVAHWWDAPNGDILGGRDLLREEKGTWLALHCDGRIGILTNFREDGAVAPEARSRGSLIIDFLTQDHFSQAEPEQFLRSLRENGGFNGIGGFSLIYGKVGGPLSVISNRTENPQDISTILEGAETVGLSNALITNRSWTKVTEGEGLLRHAVEEDADAPAPRAEFIEKLFGILSRDTLPQSKDGEDWASQVRELRKSIFIPAVGGQAAKEEAAEDLAAAKPDDHGSLTGVGRSSGYEYSETGPYGTQKQTIILVTHDRRVTFVERALVDEQGKPLDGKGNDVTLEFDIRASAT